MNNYYLILAKNQSVDKKDVSLNIRIINDTYNVRINKLDDVIENAKDAKALILLSWSKAEPLWYLQFALEQKNILCTVIDESWYQEIINENKSTITLSFKDTDIEIILNN